MAPAALIFTSPLFPLAPPVEEPEPPDVPLVVVPPEFSPPELPWPPVLDVDVEVVVPPEVLVEVDVLPDVPVLVPVDVVPEVPVVPPLVPQLMVKLMNLSPPAAGVLCRTCKV